MYCQEKKEALKKCSQSVIFETPSACTMDYLQRLDQLQLRLKQSLRTRISDNKQLVQARTHRLVNYHHNQNQRYQDRLGPVGQAPT